MNPPKADKSLKVRKLCRVQRTRLGELDPVFYLMVNRKMRDDIVRGREKDMSIN